MRSLYAFMAQVVGRESAIIFMNGGSSSCGHQHPPMAAIVMIAIAPTGKTESRAGTSAATIRPKAATANTIAAEGINSIVGV